MREGPWQLLLYKLSLRFFPFLLLITIHCLLNKQISFLDGVFFTQKIKLYIKIVYTVGLGHQQYIQYLLLNIAQHILLRHKISKILTQKISHQKTAISLPLANDQHLTSIQSQFSKRQSTLFILNRDQRKQRQKWKSVQPYDLLLIINIKTTVTSYKLLIKTQQTSLNRFVNTITTTTIISPTATIINNNVNHHTTDNYNNKRRHVHLITYGFQRAGEMGQEPVRGFLWFLNYYRIYNSLDLVLVLVTFIFFSLFSIFLHLKNQKNSQNLSSW